MIRTKLFKRTFWLLFAVGVMNWAAVSLYLYWTIWWFDMVVHFSAGACVAMASMLLYSTYSGEKIPSLFKTIKIALIGALTIGILWEIYELVFHITTFADGLNYYLDTGSDILMDISGGIIGGLYAHRILIKSTNQ